MIDVQLLKKRILATKLSIGFFIAFGYFLFAMLFDFISTAVLSEGDIALENSWLAVWWWEWLGVLRHVDFIVWPIYVFGIGFLFKAFSEFLSHWWMLAIGSSHVLGGLSWYTFAISDALYKGSEVILGSGISNLLPLSFFGVIIGFCLAAIFFLVSKYEETI